MTPPSLVETLKLIQEWQVGESQWRSRSRREAALLAVDVAALTLQTAQHAQTMRSIERCLRDGQSLSWLTSNDVRAVADWLAPEDEKA